MLNDQEKLKPVIRELLGIIETANKVFLFIVCLVIVLSTMAAILYHVTPN